MAKELGDNFLIAPQYPEPLEYVASFSTEEEANEEAWAWRRAGFYATRKEYNPGEWRVFVCDGRQRPAPEPRDPTRSAHAQSN